MKEALYNEIEPYAVEWLRSLERAGYIAAGTVDPRSVADLKPADCAAVQCHFFAGLGGWSYALRLAGWPDELPVWTGSCPCQPFSSAGRKGGFDDARHLWPEWYRLIRECRPPVIFGEQVASPDGLAWFDAVSTDLEDAGYAVGAADLCAAGVGAPHIRQRLLFVAITKSGESWTDGQIILRNRKRSGSQATSEWRARRPGGGGGSAGPGGSDQRWTAEPSVSRVADGIPVNVAQLRAFGNAIVPQAAATLIRSVIDAIHNQ